MKLRSLYILSIIGLFLVVVIQLGGMIYAYDSYKNEAKRTLNECFRQAFIETVDNRVNNLPFPDYTVPFYSYIRRDEKMPYDEWYFGISASSLFSGRCLSCGDTSGRDGEGIGKEAEMEKHR